MVEELKLTAVNLIADGNKQRLDRVVGFGVNACIHSLSVCSLTLRGAAEPDQRKRLDGKAGGILEMPRR
jgi:hypothetical protein